MRKSLASPIQPEWRVYRESIVLRDGQRGWKHLPIAAEFNLWTVADEQGRHNGNGVRGILFHNHPAESIAYRVRLIHYLEGRGGQVGCGTSQLERK